MSDKLANRAYTAETVVERLAVDLDSYYIDQKDVFTFRFSHDDLRKMSDEFYRMARTMPASSFEALLPLYKELVHFTQDTDFPSTKEEFIKFNS